MLLRNKFLKNYGRQIFVMAAIILVSLQLSLSVSMSMMGRYWEVVEVGKPFLFLLALASFLFFSARMMKASLERACFTALFLIFMFSQYTAFLTPHINNKTLIVFIALVCAVTWFVGKKPEILKILLMTLVVHASIFTLSQSVSLARYYCCQRYDLDQLPAKEDLLSEARVDSAEKAPDIYIVIQDAMGDFATTKRLFSHDSASFDDYLRRHNVYVAYDSRSYYTQTFESVSSTLNMNYFQDDVILPHSNFYDYRPAVRYFLRPRLTEFLREQGYDFHVSSTGYNLNPEGKSGVNNLRAPLFNMSAFETLKTSSIYYPLLNLLAGPERDFLNPYRKHYKDIKDQYAFLKEQAEAKADKPRFVYAHIMLPHPPFVFAADGSFGDYGYHDLYSYNDGVFHPRSDLYEGGWNDFYKKAYAAQLAYAQKEIREFFDVIHKRASGRQVVVIIQGDHGSRSLEDFQSLEKSDKTELFGITNIVYFSDHDYSLMKEDMSPINTLRAVLNKYFGAALPMLPDQHWYSTWMKPYEFLSVSEEEMEFQAQ